MKSIPIKSWTFRQGIHLSKYTFKQVPLYNLLQDIINKYKISPDLVFAMDETCCFISKKSLNFENSGELWGTLGYSGVLRVQRFFADVP